MCIDVSIDVCVATHADVRIDMNPLCILLLRMHASPRTHASLHTSLSFRNPQPLPPLHAFQSKDDLLFLRTTLIVHPLTATRSLYCLLACSGTGFLRMDMCIDMCIQIFIDVCTDMHVEMCKDTGPSRSGSDGGLVTSEALLPGRLRSRPSVGSPPTYPSRSPRRRRNHDSRSALVAP